MMFGLHQNVEISKKCKKLATQAYKDAKENFPFAKNRDIEVFVMTKDGERSGHQVEVEVMGLSGRKVKTAIRQAMEGYEPSEIASVCFQGGVDGIYNMQDYRQWSDYEPWVETWDVEVSI